MIVQTLKNLYWANSVVSGFRTLRKSGATPPQAYSALRKLYVSTNGRFNDYLSSWLGFWNPPSGIEVKDSILDQSEFGEALKALDRDGYYVFQKRLPEELLAALNQFGKTGPCRAMLNSDEKIVDFSLSEEKKPYDPNTVSPKFSFDAQDIVGNPTVQKLIMDSGFRHLAEKFLGCEPILDLVAMWWSQPCGSGAHSSVAQLYHFDMDRIKFLKFFFYLTDVDTNSGPHCYVRGSSRRKPKSVLRDGRITDEDMLEAYSANDCVEICGEAGSIIAVDTRGFHKGKMLTERNRLLLQFEFANSMFGASYSPVKLSSPVSEEFQSFVRENQRFCGILS